MDSRPSSEMAAALDRLWARFLPEIRARVEVLELAAQAIASGTLTAGQREEAANAAHKLAGTLGTFNLARGTVVARELELLYTGAGGPDRETAERGARELRELIESRGRAAS